MGVYSTTDKGNVTMTQNGAFVQFQWNDGALRVRAYNPRYLIAGIDDRMFWLMCTSERQGAPPGQPFSTEFSRVFSSGVSLATAGADFMALCAAALLAGGGP